MSLSATDLRRAAQARVLVIGYGNPLRGDDGLGRFVAERIIESARPEGIEVIDAQQLTPELAEPISRADLVIFVDAAADLPPARMRIVPIIARTSLPGSVGHYCDAAHLLDTAQQLFGRSPEAWSISAGGRFWGYSQSLSSELERLVPQLLHQIELLIAARLSSREPSHA